MGKLETKLAAYGRAKLRTSDPGKVLKILFEKKGMSKAEIGRLMDSTGAGVASAMRRFGMDAKTRVASLEEAIKEKGYSSEDECFIANGSKTIHDIADLLGVHPDTVSRRYRAFQVRRARSSKKRRMMKVLGVDGPAERRKRAA